MGVSPLVLLMVEILHQLRLVVFPITYRVSYIPDGERRISAINGTYLSNTSPFSTEPWLWEKDGERVFWKSYDTTRIRKGFSWTWALEMGIPMEYLWFLSLKTCTQNTGYPPVPPPLVAAMGSSAEMPPGAHDQLGGWCFLSDSIRDLLIPQLEVTYIAL